MRDSLWHVARGWEWIGLRSFSKCLFKGIAVALKNWTKWLKYRFQLLKCEETLGCVFILACGHRQLIGFEACLPNVVVPGSRNPTKHHRSRGWMQKQWGTLLQARAGTTFTQPNGHAERAPSDGDLFLYPIVGKMGSLRGLVNSLTKDVLLATDWSVRVRGWGTSCPPLIGLLSFFVLKFCFLSSGGGFTFHSVFCFLPLYVVEASVPVTKVSK